TFAHAIEKTGSNFLHGEAVAIGMVTAAAAAVYFGAGDASTMGRIEKALSNTGLPLRSEIDPKRLFKALTMDKKRESEDIHLVLPTGVGSCEIRTTPLVELETLMPELPC
ncbi:MAG: 3-dehydroquinate synthase, partial [Rikenellaceae bacterium]|nr:3-dehydroquinate synthase [Rikenellaceae bacterium]